MKEFLCGGICGVSVVEYVECLCGGSIWVVEYVECLCGGSICVVAGSIAEFSGV